MPYPLAPLKGRLRLSGLSDLDAENTVLDLKRHFTASGKTPTEDELVTVCRELIPSADKNILRNFDTFTQYDILRKDTEIQPLILVLEGASATGKSMLALDLITNLAATRIISTDTVRQVLRVIHTPDQHPELHCHTYQAHLHRQSGPEELDPVVRGFLAQCELISPTIKASVDRVLQEGAEAIVEGVHIVPGDFQGIGTGILEVFVNPEEELHRTMFLAKHSTTGLKTVTGDIQVRENEFNATRRIQDFMLDCAIERSVNIVALDDYDGAVKELNRLVMGAIRRLVDTTEDK
ncbi:MAG: hypothetical protein ACXADS_07435 [Candidatus Thorarchaeota archaeon]